MIDAQELIDKYDELFRYRKFAKKSLRESKLDIKEIKKDIIDHNKARWVITEVAKITQQETKEKIEKLITLALRSIFERDFTFKLRFEQKANKVYAIPIVIDDEEEFTDMKDDLAGGVVDIISLAFKIILWSMELPKRRNLFIVDEPFRFTGRLVKKAGYMLKYLSEELNFQVIMVSHDDELIEICDRVYGVKHNGKHSIVTLIKGNKRKIKRR